MDDVELRADCARCVALCCVVLAFDRSGLFAFDKAAGVACLHLTAGHRCGIHPDLEREGFSGCVRFDCRGAGQRVTTMFKDRSCQGDAAPAMSDAFRAMRQVHELLSMLRAAGRLPLAPRQARQREDLQRALSPPQGWSPAGLAAFEVGPLPGEIQAFFVSLRGLVPRELARRRLPVVA